MVWGGCPARAVLPDSSILARSGAVDIVGYQNFTSCLLAVEQNGDRPDAPHQYASAIDAITSNKINGLGGSHHPRVSGDHTGSSNPTTSAVPNAVFGGDANPNCFGDSRDSKNDSIWAARREIHRRRSNLFQTLFVQFD